MNKELEAFKRINIKCHPKSVGYDSIDEDLTTIETALKRLDQIENAKPSEALEEIGNIDLGDNPYKTFERNKLKNVYNNEFSTIKQALLKAQEQEKNKVFLKNLHNTKVKVPLVSIFNGLSKEERFAYTEHIYYHWEEMKEALEAEIEDIKTEKENLEFKAKRQEKVLSILNNKDIDIELFKKSKSVEDYNFCCVMGRGKRKELTEQEYNSIGEWLNGKSN